MALKIVSVIATRVTLMPKGKSSESLEMIDNRNKTSHIYPEEIAQEISIKIPHYYVLMKKVIDPLQPTK